MTAVAQIIGIFAMSANILSYQFKSPKKIMFLQLIGSALFVVNLIMLSAPMGAALNALGIVRSVVYMNRSRIRIPIKYVNVTFIIAYLVSYLCVFLVVGEEPTLKNLTLEFLPLIGMTAITLGFSADNAKTIRKLGFVNSPCWLTYNIFHGSIGGILCEIFGLISIVSSFIRNDVKRKQLHNERKT